MKKCEHASWSLILGVVALLMHDRGHFWKVLENILNFLYYCTVLGHLTL